MEHQKSTAPCWTILYLTKFWQTSTTHILQKICWKGFQTRYLLLKRATCFISTSFKSGRLQWSFVIWWNRFSVESSRLFFNTILLDSIDTFTNQEKRLWSLLPTLRRTSQQKILKNIENDFTKTWKKPRTNSMRQCLYHVSIWCFLSESSLPSISWIKQVEMPVSLESWPLLNWPYSSFHSSG